MMRSTLSSKHEKPRGEEQLLLTPQSYRQDR